MIASFAHREFQFWEYTVSHGFLLVRSPQGGIFETNVDIIFAGVRYVMLPRYLPGLHVVQADSDDRKQLEGVYDVRETVDHIFVLISEGRRYYVVAASCQVTETNMGIFDSPFK